jgi:hypothetical protein
MQASVHDIHLGSLDEFPSNIARLASFLSQIKPTVYFRSGDALHMPPGARSIVERGLQDVC